MMCVYLYRHRDDIIFKDLILSNYFLLPYFHHTIKYLFKKLLKHNKNYPKDEKNDVICTKIINAHTA